MTPSSIVPAGLFASLLASPALAHVDGLPHVHPSEVTALHVLFAVAGIAGLLCMARRYFAARS